METLVAAPILEEVSSFEREKRGVLQQMSDLVIERAGEHSTPHIYLGEVRSAIKDLHSIEAVSENERRGIYLKEKALRKLEDYYNFEIEAERIDREISLRREELERMVPGLTDRFAPAQNDEPSKVAPVKNFLV